MITIKTNNNIQAYTFAFIAQKFNDGMSYEQITAALVDDIKSTCGETVAKALAKVAVANFQNDVNRFKKLEAFNNQKTA